MSLDEAATSIESKFIPSVASTPTTSQNTKAVSTTDFCFPVSDEEILWTTCGSLVMTLYTFLIVEITQFPQREECQMCLWSSLVRCRQAECYGPCGVLWMQI